MAQSVVIITSTTISDYAEALGKRQPVPLIGYGWKRRGVCFRSHACRSNGSRSVAASVPEETLRRSFSRLLATTPQDYRARFGT